MNTTRVRRLQLVAAFVLPAAIAMLAVPVGAEEQLRSYADVAAKAMPAVVNISTDKVVENFQHPFMDDPIFRRFFEMPQDRDHQGERLEQSLGSGIIISEDGYILTNNHVVQSADKIRVLFEGEREYEAEVIGTDPPTDVALIKIDATGLPALEIADSDLLRIGDQVMAIGNPFGVGQTVTMGIVSALGRDIRLMQYSDLIQTDASINPGNSGGALVDMQGRLVGMNAAMLSRSGGSQGIGFAIPTKMAMRVVQALKEEGRVQRAYLGVVPQDVDQSMADYYGMERPRGVLINQVNDDTPAAESGLKEGDIILSVDGQEIRNSSMLRNVISLSDVGHQAQLAILREGQEKQITVKLEEYPETLRTAQSGGQGQDHEDTKLEGVRVRELTNRLRSMSRLPEDIEGLIVVNVEAASNAAHEGLAEGDVIQEINRRTVRSLEDFQEALKLSPDKPVFMRVYKPNQEMSIFMAVQR